MFIDELDFTYSSYVTQSDLTLGLTVRRWRGHAGKHCFTNDSTLPLSAVQFHSQLEYSVLRREGVVLYQTTTIQNAKLFLSVLSTTAEKTIE